MNGTSNEGTVILYHKDFITLDLIKYHEVTKVVKSNLQVWLINEMIPSDFIHHWLLAKARKEYESVRAINESNKSQIANWMSITGSMIANVSS